MTRTRSQLFLSAFAAQAGFLTLSPILPDVAADFDASTAAVGQLRTLSGLVGGVVALILLAGVGGLGLRTILRGSLIALVTGSLVSAVAPGMAVLAVGQIGIGAASGGLLTGGIAAAARWPAEEERPSVLTWAIVGQPAAWVVGMPLIGVAAEVSWRLTWVVLPAAGGLLALASLRNRPADVTEPPRARADAGTSIAGWAGAELLAFAAWGGTLVFAGALLRESYSISAGMTGVVLGMGAATYFAAAFWAEHRREGRVLLVAVTLALAVGIVVFGTVRPGLAFSGILFALLVFAAGARTSLASSFVLDIPAEARLRASGARAAAMQFGYLLGALVAGTAIAAGGFEAMGYALACLLALSAAGHLGTVRQGSAVRRLYESWRVGDLGDQGQDVSWSDEFLDRPAMVEWLSEWRDWRIEPERWIRLRSHLVVLVRFHGTGRTSGARVEAQGAHLWAFRRGRAARLEIFSDPALALAAADGASLDTTMSRLARIPLSCWERCRAIFSTPSSARSSSSMAAWAPPSSSST